MSAEYGGNSYVDPIPECYLCFSASVTHATVPSLLHIRKWMCCCSSSSRTQTIFPRERINYAGKATCPMDEWTDADERFNFCTVRQHRVM